MGKELEKWTRRKAVRTKVKAIEGKRKNILVIHCSCESFDNIKDGQTPRITSIAVRNFSTEQTESFAIHQSAEQKGIVRAKMRANYDLLERHMLDEFFNFVRLLHAFKYVRWDIREFIFVHWNMRNKSYGFQAIEHRYRVLGGEPVIVVDERTIDLASLLVELYGVNYMDHEPNGRFHNIAQLNEMNVRDFLTGTEEAAFFEKMEFFKLHQSTLRKVDIMADILERVFNGSLRTKSTWWEIHGVRLAIIPEAIDRIIEVIKAHWFFKLAGVAVFIIGLITTLANLL